MVVSQALHVGHRLDPAILESLAEFVCGNDNARFPIYRSSSYLTRFFGNIGIKAVHDGSTRGWWVLEILKKLQPSDLEKVILRLTDLKEYKGNKEQLRLAVKSMNEILLMEGLAVTFEGIQPVLQKSEAVNFDKEEILRPTPAKEETEFLGRQFSDEIKIEELRLDSVITPLLQSRVDEIQACPRNKVPLGTIFLLGSTLEGLLLAVALTDVSKFTSSTSAPKDKTGRVKEIYAWKLSEFINVASEIELIGLDVKKFSHVLRGFRNYIHPFQQMSQNFSPDQHTVDICWQVFKAVFSQLKTNLGK